MPTWIRNHLAALRALLVFTVLLGLLYPLAVMAVAQLPGLRGGAGGSKIESGGKVVGSRLIGQSFTGPDGTPLPQYFQSRPSATIDSPVKGQEAPNPDDTSYNPTGSAASNLGPEDVLDTLGDDGSQSLLTQVCARSKAIGELEGVDGSRPYCTPDGVGAVLKVFGPRGTDGRVTRPTRVVSANQACPAVPFLATYEGVRVECARPGEDLAAGATVPVRGGAPADPRVPADAVTASGSGLDPHISPAYARLQAARVARTRGVPVERVLQAIDANRRGRDLGFMGEPRVNVVQLNHELDTRFPVRK
ncbi:potassium-transporting ATPase subunit C [Actinomadura craniellae]|nr:potassium-transporting ATPase subunit C [Actinomadura craniellae]